MREHWPLVIAAGLIVLAAAFGQWQHDRAIDASTPQRASVPMVAQATPGPERQVSAEVTPAAPAAPIAPAAQPAPTETVQVAPPQLPKTAPQAAPNAAPVPPEIKPAVTPRKALVPTPPAPAVNVNPAPAAPGANPAAPVAPTISRREMRTQILADLRGQLQQKLNVLPMDVAGGGYALTTEGARIEVQPLPNWSISIYNINPKTPDVETPDFKTILDFIITTLGMDQTQKPVESQNGKTYLKATSKMGSISLVRDPATGNSAVIRPNQQWAPAVTKDANVIQPPEKVGQPAPPLPTKHPKIPAVPVAPPRPPSTDQNF